LEIILDQAKIDADAAWDGMHGVITNIRDCEPETILAKYKRLWVIEQAFRINKHNLKMRPIFHYKKERIESHIALCYMSFAILKHLQYRVSLTQKISVEDIIETLLDTQSSIHIHKVTKDRYRIPGHVSHKISKIYKALGMTRSQNAEIYLPN
jgi:transposase